jgi:hypothetical protein
VGYVVAGLVAGVLGAVEQYNRLSKAKPTRRDRAWLYWTLRILLEMAIGVAAFRIAVLAKSSLEAQPLAWVAAGAAGPTLVRTRIIDLGEPDTAKPLGIAAAYEPIRDWIADRLDDISAAAQSRWLTEELLPLLNRCNTPPKEIAERLMRWVEGSRRFSKVEAHDQRTFVEQTLAGTQPEDIKRELLVRRGVELRAYRVLRDLKRSCRG